MRKRNLFEDIPGELAKELVETLAEGNGSIRIERIVSRGHTSPHEFWYDQDTTEWVVLLKGSAVLQFEKNPELIELHPGDWLEIPAYSRHRVEDTSSGEDTVWLAVHWGTAL